MMQIEMSKQDAPSFLTVSFPLIAKLINLVGTY
jgi:hypothetical protein